MANDLNTPADLALLKKLGIRTDPTMNMVPSYSDVLQGNVGPNVNLQTYDPSSPSDPKQQAPSVVDTISSKIAPQVPVAAVNVEQPKPEVSTSGYGVKDAIANALMGAAKGWEAASKGNPYNPLGSGILGGLSATSAGLESGMKKNSQDAYSKYMALSEEDKMKPENTKSGMNAALALGFDPSMIQARQKLQNILPPEIADALRIRHGLPATGLTMRNEDIPALKSLDQIKQGAWSPTQADLDILNTAAHRKENPLDIVGLKARGISTQALVNSLKSDPNYDPSVASAATKAKIQGATSEAGAAGRVRGGKGTETEATVGTLHDVIGYARPYVERLSPTQLTDVNQAFRAGLQHLSDPDANSLLVHMNEIHGLYSQILKGGGTPTDMDNKHARDAIANGLDSQGFEATAKAIVLAGQSRAGRLTGKKSNVDVYSTTEQPKMIKMVAPDGRIFPVPEGDVKEAENLGAKRK